MSEGKGNIPGVASFVIGLVTICFWSISLGIFRQEVNPLVGAGFFLFFGIPIIIILTVLGIVAGISGLANSAKSYLSWIGIIISLFFICFFIAPFIISFYKDFQQFGAQDVPA